MLDGWSISVIVLSLVCLVVVLVVLCWVWYVIQVQRRDIRWLVAQGSTGVCEYETAV